MEFGFKTNYDFKNPSVLIIFLTIPRDYNLQEEYIPNSKFIALVLNFCC